MNHKINQVLAAVLLVVALLTGQSAWAESSWEVTNSNGNSNTFTIKRSEKGYEQTVHFRTISLSAYAGQHFTAVDMDYTFLDNEDEKTVTVTEMNPSTNAYKYQTGASRKYGFEVIDRAGFRLAYAERSKTWGTSVTSSGVFDIKDVTIQTSEYTANDDGYNANGYKSVDADKYCTSGTQAYLGFLNAQLRMTLSFDAKENDDAYEYLQILFDNTSTCDNRSGAGNGNPGTPTLSSYMAGFEMNTGSTDNTYRNYTFPVTSAKDNANATNPWGHGTEWPLTNQKFKSGSRASDGRLIVPMNFSSIVLRLNASGSSGSDEWAVKNVKAHIQAIDGTAPTKSAVSVNPGRHAKGNTVYVSVAFSEIVTVTGTPTLTTTTNNNWGSLTYVDGSGTNVLTFSTTIPQDATGSLNITGLSGTVKDLAGNSLSGGVTASSVCTLDDDFAYTINDFQQEGGNYLIKTHEDLIGLAGYVNGGGATKDKTFLQVADIAFAHTTNWNSSASTENNYTAIGYYMASDDQKNFEGTYDGGGHTISGIRIYRNNNTDSDNYQGLFGHVKSNGAIRNVNLSDTRITGRSTVGGIVGYNMGTVEDCTVAANVCIHQIYGGSIHGGVVGYNLGSVKRCISSAHLTVKNGISTSGYGGIVGRNEDAITDCIATDVVIPDVNARGAIVGVLYNNGTLTRNYYRGCKVASNSVTPSGVGQGTADSKTTSDVDGARALYAITLGTNVTLVRNGTDLPGTNNRTYDNGADINGQPYAYATATVTLGYSGEVGTGYHVEYSTTAGSIDGSTLTMPAEAVTVSATIPANSYTVHFDANATNGITATGTMNNQAFTYDADQTLTANAFTREGYTFAGWNTQADGQGTSYTNQQVTPNVTGDNNATVTLYAQWNVINWTGSGTQGSPYLIIYPSQLVKLAEDSQSNNYNNKYFQLHDDLNMSGVTIGPIGNNNNCFKGTFDGDGHAIRNLTINKPDNTQVGLFSTIYSSCTIKNLIIDGASITGKNFVGALVGYFLFGGTIENCLVVNSSVTVTNPEGTRGGAISGEWSNSATLSGNYYLDCSVTLDNNAVNATNIGTGYGDKAGARSVHMLTLPEHVTVSGGETVTYNTVTYYASNVSVTLSPKAGNLTDVLVNGTPATDNGDGTWSFTMPAADATVTATISVPYIAADGTTQYCTDFTVLESSNSNVNLGTSGETHWYVASGDVTINGRLQFNNSHSHLIVCDGATLTVTSSTGGYSAISGKDDGDGITIYGQTQQSGTVNATSSSNAIYACGPVTINGGIINATGYDGIFVAIYGITINGGSITAIGSRYGISGTNVTINGGTVSATGSDYGIEADETITLGWTNATDRIYANSYSKNPVVKSGQTFTDGTNAYSGSVNKSNIAGQTLQPCYSITLPAHVIATGVISQNGTTAYAMPPAAITLSAEANFALANVEVNGTAATDNGDGTWSFTMPAEDVTVTATVKVPYIAADGTTQYCASYTLIESSQYNVSLGSINNDEAWYVAPAGEVTINGLLYISGKAVHLILCDGAELTVTCDNNDAVNCPRSLTIYGQSAQSGSLTATSNGSTACGITADDGDITVNGGIISATSNNYKGIWARNLSSGNGKVTINRGSVTATSNGSSFSYGIQANNNVTINGGIVSATGNSGGIYATGTITLGWTNATDRITASIYNRNPVVKSGQMLTDGTAAYTGTVDKSAIAGKTLSPVLVLADNADNTSAIATNNGSTLAVQLTGRTLYKDGDWNTLCLPFDLASLMGTPLEGATVKTLTSTAFADGTLTLNFTEDANNLTSIEAGKPYIVKWSKPDGYDGHGSDYDLQNPVFTGVTIESDMDNVTTDYVTFCGTYSPIDYASDNNSILFLGLHNTLYYPQAGAHIGACRAYFELRNGLTAASITNARLAFDDEEETTSMVDVRGKMADGRSDIYNLNGQKVLNPTKGLYIVNGRKVIIK